MCALTSAAKNDSGIADLGGFFAEFCKEMTSCFCCCEVYGGFGKCGGKGRILKQGK